MATNCLGPYFFTQLLLPTLLQTAKESSGAAVRVIWTSSLATELVALGAPKNGVDVSNVSTPSKNQQDNYAISKIGNWYLASELASQVGKDGILSVTVNPGNLKTDLLRHLPVAVFIIFYPLLYPAVYGAYSELWAGFSSELSMRDGGNCIIPWGRIHPNPSPRIIASLGTKEMGGTGEAKAFVGWCDAQTGNFRE